MMYFPDKYDRMMESIGCRYKVLLDSPNGKYNINRQVYEYFIIYTETHQDHDPYWNMYHSIKNWLNDTEAMPMEIWVPTELMVAHLLRELPDADVALQRGRKKFFDAMGKTTKGFYEEVYNFWQGEECCPQ